ncbi:MAG: DNA polymerase III subunit beta [Chloroflexota bacterium]|nr:DNA polymerase III subunit beta [Chloroflexota bacterium]MYE32329.1 DNA polymerase III subunit beta [Chloroflexota bacterium]
MQLTVQQEDLNRGLSAVARAVPTRSTLPITNNILLEADDDQLTLSATDAETIAITYRIASGITEAGTITLPSRLLSDFVATLPPQPIEIALAERSRQVSLSCARNEASIGGQAADEFPPIPPVEEGDTIQLDADALRRSINQVAFAAATDDSRPVLTGVHFALRDGSLRLAAADGFRLAVNTIEVGENSGDREAIVPARALNELARLLPEVTETISVTFNPAGTQVLFDLGHATLVAQLIQGTFPNYEQLIPSGHATSTEVSVGEFMRETRIASIFARDGSGIVRLIASPGEGSTGRLTVTARAEEVGNNEGEIDALVDGEEARIAFNSRYLIEVLGALDTDRVAIETSSPSSPGVLRPVGNDDYVHVVMPMFVQW